ncbi:MAG TPA: hypothetical protein VK894_05480 [Jiangellales bacterium]|nr:hypothetical protein [Jiangellales bacterium]
MTSVTSGSVRDRSLVVPALAALRLGFAGWMGARPLSVARSLGARRPTTLLVPVRAAAVREAVIGGGSLVAWRRGRPAAGWVLAMAAADATDALLYVAGSRRGRLDPAVARRAAWFAASGVVSEALTAAWLAAGSHDRRDLVAR